MVNNPVFLPVGLCHLGFFVQDTPIAVTGPPVRESRGRSGLCPSFRGYSCVGDCHCSVPGVVDRASALTVGERKKILVINSFSPDTKGVLTMNAIRFGCRRGVPNSIEMIGSTWILQVYDEGYERQWHLFGWHISTNQKTRPRHPRILPGSKIRIEYKQTLSKTPMIICPVG